MTAAILGSAPLVRRARLIIVGSRLGGRLSITNQSRSSSVLAALPPPAPDIPVMITMSEPGSPEPGPAAARPVTFWAVPVRPCPSRRPLGGGPGALPLRRTVPLRRPLSLRRAFPLRPEGGQDGVGQLRPDARYQRQFFRGGRGDPPHRAEVPQQCGPAGRAPPPESRKLGGGAGPRPVRPGGGGGGA